MARTGATRNGTHRDAAAPTHGRMPPPPKMTGMPSIQPPGPSPALGLPPEAFARPDPSPDGLFYAEPRFVTHIDAAALARVTALYREVLPEGGAVLDLMGSWVSHLPEEMAFAEVVGHGMNAAELAANPRLSRWFVQDLNRNPRLPLADDSLDACCLCVSVQYLQHPVAVLGEVRRVLRPAAPLVVSFSNRCFPTKAVAVWRSLPLAGQGRYVTACMEEAGFAPPELRVSTPPGGDPLVTLVARTS